jgi:nucleotide-binding universal stress UspA family protein
MIELKRILCPVDESETSMRALQYAVLLARAHGGEVRVLEVVEEILGPATLVPEASRLLADARRFARVTLAQFVGTVDSQGVNLALEVRDGDVVTQILEEASTWPADVVVMGTHGERGFQRLLLGSVTEKVLRQAARPVMTVPPAAQLPSNAASVFRGILCGVDFSTPSLSALKYARSLAAQAGARLLVMHVVEWPFEERLTEGMLGDYQRREEDEAHRLLRQLIPSDDETVEHVVTAGKAYREILRVAGERTVGLIVLGVQGRGAIDRALFGSTTDRVIREARCTVLTVRNS